MKKWQPAPAQAVAAFNAVTAERTDIEPRKMFGYACVFARGHLLAGLHQAGLILRLPEAARTQFIERFGAALFEPMPGRAMREYVVVPPALYAATDELRGWFETGLRYVSALPSKPVKRAGSQRARTRSAAATTTKSTKRKA